MSDIDNLSYKILFQSQCQRLKKVTSGNNIRNIEEAV